MEKQWQMNKQNGCQGCQDANEFTDQTTEEEMIKSHRTLSLRSENQKDNPKTKNSFYEFTLEAIAIGKNHQQDQDKKYSYAKKILLIVFMGLIVWKIVISSFAQIGKIKSQQFSTNKLSLLSFDVTKGIQTIMPMHFFAVFRKQDVVDRMECVIGKNDIFCKSECDLFEIKDLKYQTCMLAKYRRESKDSGQFCRSLGLLLESPEVKYDCLEKVGVPKGKDYCDEMPGDKFECYQNYGVPIGEYADEYCNLQYPQSENLDQFLQCMSDYDQPPLKSIYLCEAEQPDWKFHEDYFSQCASYERTDKAVFEKYLKVCVQYFATFTEIQSCFLQAKFLDANSCGRLAQFSAIFGSYHKYVDGLEDQLDFSASMDDTLECYRKHHISITNNTCLELYSGDKQALYSCFEYIGTSPTVETFLSICLESNKYISQIDQLNQCLNQYYVEISQQEKCQIQNTMLDSQDRVWFNVDKNTSAYSGCASDLRSCISELDFQLFINYRKSSQVYSFDPDFFSSCLESFGVPQDVIEYNICRIQDIDPQIKCKSSYFEMCQESGMLTGFCEEYKVKCCKGQECEKEETTKCVKPQENELFCETKFQDEKNNKMVCLDLVDQTKGPQKCLQIYDESYLFSRYFKYVCLYLHRVILDEEALSCTPFSFENYVKIIEKETKFENQYDLNIYDLPIGLYDQCLQNYEKEAIMNLILIDGVYSYVLERTQKVEEEIQMISYDRPTNFSPQQIEDFVCQWGMNFSFFTSPYKRFGVNFNQVEYETKCEAFDHFNETNNNTVVHFYFDGTRQISKNIDENFQESTMIVNKSETNMQRFKLSIDENLYSLTVQSLKLFTNNVLIDKMNGFISYQDFISNPETQQIFKTEPFMAGTQQPQTFNLIAKSTRILEKGQQNSQKIIGIPLRFTDIEIRQIHFDKVNSIINAQDYSNDFTIPLNFDFTEQTIEFHYFGLLDSISLLGGLWAICLLLIKCFGILAFVWFILDLSKLIRLKYAHIYKAIEIKQLYLHMEKIKDQIQQRSQEGPLDIQEELRNDLTKIDNAIAMEHATYQGASLKLQTLREILEKYNPSALKYIFSQYEYKDEWEMLENSENEIKHNYYEMLKEYSLSEIANLIKERVSYLGLFMTKEACELESIKMKKLKYLLRNANERIKLQGKWMHDQEQKSVMVEQNNKKLEMKVALQDARMREQEQKLRVHKQNLIDANERTITQERRLSNMEKKLK